MIPLRPYQSDLVADIRAAWQAGHRNTMAVLATGGGKTVCFSAVLSEEPGASVAIAHRQELVGQMSQALARCGVAHRIIAPQAIIKRIAMAHVQELGRSYYDPRAKCAVAGVDTLLRRGDHLQQWMRDVRLWVTDEAHHLLRENKWGKAADMFPHARGLGVTATPIRADGKGLGRHADGLIDTMVHGPSMRDLINAGWLTDYRVFCPKSDVDLSQVHISQSTGDYNANELRSAVRKSHIIGDVVQHYRRIAPGKLGVTFATDVETATDIAGQFNAAGVPAEVVSAKTPDGDRAHIIGRFRRRELVMLVNVDLFGEGFDLPAIEVVIMARPTESFALYAQQFGRALRPMEGKDRAIIIDHVGNVVRHGLPDAPREWTLDARDKRGRNSPDDGPKLRACLNVECMNVYERFLPACPYCGEKPTPASRSAPEFVDGDLTELDPAVLSAMRGEVARVDMPAEEYRADLAAQRCPTIGQHANVKRHIARQEAQATLRDAIAWWAGHHRAAGRSDAEIYRRFWHAFGTDVLTAQALGRDDALALAERIGREVARGV